MVQYAYGPEGVAAQRTLGGGTSQGTLYPLLDAQASVRHLADASGAVVRSQTYDAWGAVRHASGSATTRLGSTGELQTGALVYLRARWYHAANGTFTTRDRFPGIPERPQSLHKYLAENNPATFSDPSGYCRPESIPGIGEHGCDWIWQSGQGLNWQDGGTFLWNVFQNIGLPGAMVGDYVNTLLGHPSNVTEAILSQDRAAAALGNVFREVTTLGAATRLPAVGRALAGWNFARGTVHIVCNPATPGEELGYVADTVIVILTLRGGPASFAIPSSGMAWSAGGAAALRQVASATVVRVNTQAMAGALAGVQSMGGMLVLLAQGSGGSSDSDHIVLGLRAFDLERTAQSVGGRTLLNDPNWRSTLLTAINDPSTKFTISLDGLSGSSTYSKIMNAVQRGLGGNASPTNWELAQLYQAGRLQNATFVQGGRIVDNPFK